MPFQNEQYESKESFYHLDICCRIAAEKYGRPVIEEWTNGDYIKLSGQLFRQAAVQISPSTLKRIFGKLKTTDRYYPQKATRDALAFYTDFTDWETFVQKHPRPAKQEEKKPEQGESKIDEPVLSQTKIIHKKRNWLPVIIIMAAVATIAVWLFLKKEKPGSIDTTGIKFVCINPEGENPHSATFKIQLPEDFSGDSSNFTIDFGDGETLRRVAPSIRKISPAPQHSHYYEVPGRYYAVLKYNDLPIDTVPVYLKSNGWTATATMERDTMRVYPVNNSSLFKNGNMMVNTDELFHAGIDTNHTFYVSFVNTKPLAINGDNFELTYQVTSSQPRPGVRCSQVNVYLYGEESQHTVIFMKPGCEVHAYFRFSEIYKDGATDDLSSIGADLTAGGIIKLQVINKKVKLFLNDKQLYETSYHFPLKKVYGIKISFAGIGVVNDVLLKDLGTGEVFNEGFEKR